MRPVVPLAALLLLPAVAAASGPFTIEDDVLDVLATMTRPVEVAAPCYDPALDITRLTYASDGETLFVHIEVVDIHGAPTCAGLPVERTSFELGFQSFDFAAGKGIFSSARAKGNALELCTMIGFPSDQGVGLSFRAPSCEMQDLGAPIEWAIPLSGVVTWPGGWERPYDFRGEPLRDGRGLAREDASGPVGSAYFLQDHTSSFWTWV